MSSWLRPPQKKQALLKSDFYWKASTSGYCSNFFSYFMALLFARHASKPLYIHDTSSNLSASVHLIQDTFLPQPDVKYTAKLGTNIYTEYIQKLHTYINTLKADEVRDLARGVFTFTPAVQEAILAANINLPQIDIGVHIRTGDKITTGEMKAITLDKFVEAIQVQQRLLQKDRITAYIMTDNADILQPLRDKLGSNVTCVRINPPATIHNGHDQGVYNTLRPEIKQKAFYHFLTELYILQQAPQVICTFSSNIGRFLYMTRESVDKIISLDIQEFYLLEHLRR